MGFCPGALSSGDFLGICPGILTWGSVLLKSVLGIHFGAHSWESALEGSDLGLCLLGFDLGFCSDAGSDLGLAHCLLPRTDV